MHCGARFLRSGLRLVCRQQQRLASVSGHIVQSPLPDVQLPKLCVPEFLWQRVDQWPEKVAFVSIAIITRTIHIHAFRQQPGVELFGKKA